jgi:DNA-binding NtrC family response regulator
MLRTPRIILLTGNHAEARSLQDALGGYASLDHVVTSGELRLALTRANYDAVFCAWEFYESEWDGSLGEARGGYPELPIIVLSDGERPREWNAVIEAGAFDLLPWPCQRTSVLAVVEQAVASHHARKAQKLPPNTETWLAGGGRQTRSQEEQEQMLRVTKILLLCPADAEAEELSPGLVEHVNLTRIRNLNELKEQMGRDLYDAVFCGSSFHRARCQDALEVIGIIAGDDFPVVFLSRSEEPKQWEEVFAAGGFDLLHAPCVEFQTPTRMGEAVEALPQRKQYNGNLHQEVIAV